MDIDFTFRAGEDLPAAALRQILASGPVFWSENAKAWVVCAHGAVKEVLSDLSRFTSVGTPVEDTLGPEGMLLNDTSLHNAMRSVWAQALSRSALAARGPELEALAAQVLAPARTRLEAGQVVDLMPLIQQFALLFVSRLFDVPESRLQVIARWGQLSADAPVLELTEDSPAWAQHLAAKQDVYQLVHEQVADRRERLQRGEQPRDLVGLMAAAEGRNGVTAAMVADNLFNLIIGSDTTERWLGNIIVELAAAPALRERLRADRSLIEPAALEVMRLDTVAQVIMRRVQPDGAVLCGQRLRGGDQILVMLGAANRDPAEFENPDVFDLDRPAAPNIGFGFSFHHCLGINIARQEAITFTHAFLHALPNVSVVACEYGTTWALRGPRSLTVRREPSP